MSRRGGRAATFALLLFAAGNALAALLALDRARIEASVRALAPPFAAAYGAFGAEPRPLPREPLAGCVVHRTDAGGSPA